MVQTPLILRSPRIALIAVSWTILRLRKSLKHKWRMTWTNRWDYGISIWCYNYRLWWIVWWWRWCDVTYFCTIYELTSLTNTTNHCRPNNIYMLSGNLFYNTVNKPFSCHLFNSYLTTTYLVSSLFQCTQGEKIDKLGVESHGRTVWIESFYGRTNPHFMVKHGAVLLIHRVCER